MRKILIITILFCCGYLPAAMAQSLTMKDFALVAAKIKALKTYSYETETSATFPDGKKEKMNTTLYMDAPQKRLSYKTSFQTVILTGKWFYKVDHAEKYVSVFDVARYKAKYKNAQADLQEIFNTNLTSVFLDSVLLPTAKLVSGKKEGALLSFSFSFPKDSYIKEMILVYNSSKNLPEQIRIRTFQPDGYNKSRGTTLEMKCGRYTATIPETVFNMDQYFQVSGGKAVLKQYKNYKLSAIL
jgi:hypothetical protein